MLAARDYTLHPQPRFDLRLQTRLLLSELIIMLHYRFEVAPQLLLGITDFLELIQPQQTGQLVSIYPIAFVAVAGDPGIGLRM